jgi:hypothetical protein
MPCRKSLDHTVLKGRGFSRAASDPEHVGFSPRGNFPIRVTVILNEVKDLLSGSEHQHGKNCGSKLPKL